MKNTYLTQIRLNPWMLGSRESMTRCMKQELDLPDWFGGNLDALSDVLSEVSEETVFEVETRYMQAFSEEGYARRALRVILRAVEENPHLHLYLTDSDWIDQIRQNAGY